jgi:replicative DNA helicase
MGARDLNDRHRAGELEIEVTGEPLALGEIPLEDAEDMWLSVIALVPGRIDFSKVMREHLSHRARIVLEIIRAHVGAGWPQVAAEHLMSDLADATRLKYWKALKKPPEVLDLRSIPARLRNFAPEDVPLEVAEQALIRAWHKEKFVLVHHFAADMALEKGVEAADNFLLDRTARMTALTAGVRWRSFGEVALQYVDQMRDKLVNPREDNLIGTGFARLDRMIRFWGPRKFTVCAGWNGHGKSTLIAQLLSAMAVSGVPSFYISGEDEMLITVERILSWLIDDMQVARRLATGEPKGPKIDGYSITDVYALDELIKRVRELPLQLLHLPNAPLGQVCAAIADGARHGARVGAHDYLSTVAMPPGWDVTDWRNHSLRTLKAAFISNGMHGIEGAQLKRPGERDEKATRPTRYMIGNCPAAEEAADYVILVWRKFKGQTSKIAGVEQPIDTEEAELIVDKSKDSKTGVLRVAWCNTRHRFDYLPTDAEQTHLADAAFAPPKGLSHAEAEDPF